MIYMERIGYSNMEGDIQYYSISNSIEILLHITLINYEYILI